MVVTPQAGGTHKMLSPAKSPAWLSTGQAALVCAVKPDTVLKWIKSGRLVATRTAGGHYRIEERVLRTLAARHAEPGPEERPAGVLGRPLRCWEYLSDRGETREDCLKCVVYRVRAAWCFELAGVSDEIGHGRQYCGTTCEHCAYYQRVTARSINSLIVTSDAGLSRFYAPNRPRASPCGLRATATRPRRL